MTISKKLNGTELILDVVGRLDTTTAPDLESELDISLGEVTDLVFNLEGLDYVSSAGLRVFLKAQKIMNAKGTMKLINVNETILEVFEITGFVDILTIE